MLRISTVVSVHSWRLTGSSGTIPTASLYHTLDSEQRCDECTTVYLFQGGVLIILGLIELPAAGVSGLTTMQVECALGTMAQSFEAIVS